MSDAPDRILVLGMMGAGKTTVGRALSERLGWPFLDNDALVRMLTGREPAQIDATDGPDALHDAEAAALRAALDRPGPAVIAVAGSVVDRADARSMTGAGHTVWLRARTETLRVRIGSGQGRRADATDLEWLADHAAAREPAYRGLADQVVDVDRASVDEIVRAIVDGAGLGSSAG